MREAEGHSWGAGLGDLLLPRGLDDAGEVLVELARADRGYQVVEQLVELANVRERDRGLARGQLQRSTGPVDAHRHGPRRVLVPPLLDARLFSTWRRSGRLDRDDAFLSAAHARLRHG